MKKIFPNNLRVLILTHFNYTEKGPIHGPTHSLTSFFQRNKVRYEMLAYPLYSGRKSIKEMFDAKRTKTKEFGLSTKLPLFLKSTLETLYTLFIARNNKYTLIFSVDPLNTVAAVLLKWLGVSQKVIFYTVDYAKVRFPNKFLNFTYHAIDKFCIKNADFIWNVSTRIYEQRKNQKVPASINFYVPNAPSFKSAKRLSPNKVDRFNIVMVTGVTHTSIFENVIRALSQIAKKFPNLRLTIIGTGSYEPELRKKISLSSLKDKVQFLGQLEHEKLMETLPSKGVGLALYTKDFPWTNFGDSMKAREYLVCGLPVVITDVVSTSDDIKKYDSGIVIKQTAKEIKEAIVTLLADREIWLEKRKNAIKLAKDTDIDVTLYKAFGRVFT